MSHHSFPVQRPPLVRGAAEQLRDGFRPALAWLSVALLALSFSSGVRADATPSDGCGDAPLAVQVLGSGGPELLPDRAASSYLVRVAGRGRVLVDIGGGSARRFTQAGGRIEELDLLLLTHLHVDHSGDLPALVKAAYFGSRNRPLPVLGPAGRGVFPSTTQWAARLIGPQGAYAYLQDQLQLPGEPQRRGPVFAPRDIEVGQGRIRVAHDADGLRVLAAPVHHGPVPALAWRVEARGHAVVFSGDTAGDDPAMTQLAASADLLVAHHAVPESARGAARDLHMPPSVIGRIAGEAKVGALVLSHRMRRTLGDAASARASIARHYDGPLRLADDLDCFGVNRRGAADKADEP